MPALSRKQKRKLAKKAKRSAFKRQEAARKAEENDRKWKDPEYRLHLFKLEMEEAEREEAERKRRDEEEMEWIKREEEFQRALKEKEEEEKKKKIENREKEILEKNKHSGKSKAKPLIIWKGNEIIVVKDKIPETETEPSKKLSEYSNPLPPEHVDIPTFSSNSTLDARLDTGRIPDPPTKSFKDLESEKETPLCSFYSKTGCCRFGAMCKRFHPYPNTSHVLLIKSMYSFPSSYENGSLEYDDEELFKHYEEFYEDVHFEFLKFGMILNFKVSKNDAKHLRGNVYVHFLKKESAIDAYNFMNGRFYAAKQISCEFIPEPHWKSSICGEFLHSTRKVGYSFGTCQWGEKCNFLHVMRNPGGEYEWMDWDEPPPKDWQRKMRFLYSIQPEESAQPRRKKRPRPHERSHASR